MNRTTGVVKSLSTTSILISSVDTALWTRYHSALILQRATSLRHTPTARLHQHSRLSRCLPGSLPRSLPSKAVGAWATLEEQDVAGVLVQDHKDIVMMEKIGDTREEPDQSDDKENDG